VSDDLPLKPPAEKPKPTPAPAWVALLAAWLGLLTLIASIALPLLPGSRNPRQELEHARPYSLADRFLPVPVYGSVLTLFIGLVVLWQMRKEPRPLPDAMVAQRLQAKVGIGLALAAIVIFYAYAALRATGRHL
jgi:hypothetical protein